MSNDVAILSTNNLPDLNKAEKSVLSLSPEYLDIESLEKDKEMRFFYLGIKERDQPDFNTGEIKSMKCVLLAHQDENKNITVYESAAKRLVMTLERVEKDGLITPNESGLSITYKGKKKNKSNSHSSAAFDIRYLSVKPQAVA